MNPRRPTHLAPVLAGSLLAGCFVDGGHVNPEPSTATTEVTGGESGTGASPTSTGALTTGSSDATTGGTDDPSGEPTTTTSTTTTAVETTGPPPPSCGDGVVDDDEQCDDGNQSNKDFCLDDCSPASCEDGHANQDESDIDCGGPCLPCPACDLCNGNSDCGVDFACVGGRCRAGAEVVIDWQVHCGEDSQAWTEGPKLPEGVYTITALGGGGTFGDPPTYMWTAECENLGFGPVQTDNIYGSEQEAFDALRVKAVDNNFPGGPLRCGVLDNDCDDNVGGANFSVWLACD